MRPFNYMAAADLSDAVMMASKDSLAVFLAGGTNLIDEMKLNIRTPRELVDISGLPLNQIETSPHGGLRIGAMVRNSNLAWNEQVRSQYPVLAEALLSGASPQLRNMASTGGNLLQRTRCPYYRDISRSCNMREPGSGCSAIAGFNRMHAVLGTSNQCIATHPSDMCVALTALEATIHIVGSGAERDVPITEFYVAYGNDPAKLNVLNQGDLITYVDLPPAPWAARSHYLKVRDRTSYEFALASAAVALDLDGNKIRGARIALGGVATKPWRASEAEKRLVGGTIGDELFHAAADEAMQTAIPQRFNAFKIELAKRTIVRALTETAAI